MYKAYFHYVEREPEKISFSYIPYEKQKIKFRNPKNETVPLVITDDFSLSIGGDLSKFISFIVRKNESSNEKQYLYVKKEDTFEKFGVAPEVD